MTREISDIFLGKISKKFSYRKVQSFSWENRYIKKYKSDIVSGLVDWLDIYIDYAHIILSYHIISQTKKKERKCSAIKFGQFSA